MRHLILLFLAFILVSCGGAYVVHDYDEKQDFLEYKTYAFYPEMVSGLSDLDQKRLLMVTENEMKAKGFIKSEAPDIYINFKTSSSEKASTNTIGVGVGSGGGGINIGLGGAIPVGGSQTILELTIDFIDVKKDALVWQAITERRFHPNASPNTRTNFFQQIIKKSMNKYPPKK